MMRFLALRIYLALAGFSIANAQQIAIDRGIRAGTVWCFPLASDSLTYYYLPIGAQLATTEKGLPGFSFLRYMTLQKNATGNSISDADGEAVLHFLVSYNTPQEAIRKAESLLQKKTNSPAKIRGSVVFRQARYSLISSTLNSDKSQVLRTGEAPVLENSSLAFSFELKPVDSKILLESFKTGTADVSIIFDFTFEGVSDSYDAKLEIDWARVHEQRSSRTAAQLFSTGIDVQNDIDNLLKNDAIRLTSSGESRALESLVDRTYNKILDLLYEPVRAETEVKSSENQSNYWPRTITNLIREVQKVLPVSLNNSYKTKTLKTEGSTVYNFKGRSTLERHHFITFNIGDIYTTHGSNPAVFRDVALTDEPFQQREISLAIDGSVERDFNRMLNNVTVIVRKKHQDSSVTVNEFLINKETLKKTVNPSISYLNQGDHDRLLWLTYEYQVIWKFVGGGQLIANWVKENSPVISLYLPYKQWKLDFSGDMKKLEEMGVTAIVIQALYEFVGQQKTERITIRPPENPEKKALEFTVPTDQEAIDYSITWIKKDGTQLTTQGKDKHGLVFIDNVPVN